MMELVDGGDWWREIRARVSCSGVGALTRGERKGEELRTGSLGGCSVWGGWQYAGACLTDVSVWPKEHVCMSAWSTLEVLAVAA